MVLFRELMGIMWDIYIVTKDMNFKGTSNNGAVRGVSISHEPLGMIPAATAVLRQP